MGWFIKHPTGRRAMGLISSVLIVGACFAITAAAFASPGQSCHGSPHAQGRCDASTDSFGLSNLAPPVERFLIPELRLSGRIGWQPLPAGHNRSVYGSITPRAPPLP